MKTEKRPITPSYTEAFRRVVIEDYLRSGLSKMSIQHKHGVRFKSAIVTWMRELGYSDTHKKVSILEASNQLELAKKYTSPQSDPNDAVALAKRIKELERQLEDEKIRTEMLNMIIDIAEKDYKLPIRKKPGTK
jgi:transposase